MLADLGFSVWQMFLQLFPWIQASLLLFFSPSFLACSGSNGDSVCSYSPQCAIPRETPRFNNVIRV